VKGALGGDQRRDQGEWGNGQGRAELKNTTNTLQEKKENRTSADTPGRKKGEGQRLEREVYEKTTPKGGGTVSWAGGMPIQKSAPKPDQKNNNSVQKVMGKGRVQKKKRDSSSWWGGA